MTLTCYLHLPHVDDESYLICYAVLQMAEKPSKQVAKTNMGRRRRAQAPSGYSPGRQVFSSFRIQADPRGGASSNYDCR